MTDGLIDIDKKSELNNLPRRYKKISITRYFIYLALIVMVIWSFQGSQFSFEGLLDSTQYFKRFLGEAFPSIGILGENEHSITWKDTFRYTRELIETFQMAFTGTLLGIIFGFILALLSSKGLLGNSRPMRLVQETVKALILLFRTVPDLVWAIIFVMLVGLGAFAGTLTIMVDTIGFCGRFFAEEMEDVDKSPADALESCGATKLDATFAAVVPAAMPGLITTSLFAFEKAIRGSVVLGLVGAGGIGMSLNALFNWMAYDRAMVIIGMIFALIFVVEQVSQYLRRKVTQNEEKRI
jgi:phosphonate transport system permease protein